MILIVDDQPEVSDYVARLLDRKGYRTDCAACPEEALARLRDPARTYSLAILDLDLGGGADDGLALLQQAREVRPGLPVLILTGKGTIELAVKALKLGAQDFLEKDFHLEEALDVSMERVQRFLEVVAENRKLTEENRDLRVTAALLRELQHFKYRPVGRSQAFLEVLDRARRLASIPRPVLISGERGTGKELIAATIHYAGERRDKPFVTLNCAACTGSLLESEMFGHERGAFTGADRQRAGRFELADGGTLLLDEIGNMSPAFQEKVLRVVEYQEFERIGGRRPIKVDVRVIGATNADLEKMIEAGEFRADLYDRLTFEVLQVPPLRERQDDIPVLVEHFAEQFAAEVKLPERRFAPAALEALCAYRWPGNVRELRNVVERMVFGARSETIEVTDLPAEVREGGPAQGRSFSEQIESLERRLLEEALAETGWNQKRAAERLGLTYDQLRHYYRKHGLKKSGS